MRYRTVVTLLISIAVGCTSAASQEITEVGDAFFLKDKTEKTIAGAEPSAIQVIDEEYALVADDKTSTLSVIKISNGVLVSPLEIPGFAGTKPKWEGLAYDGTFFYLTGSYAVKLDDPDEAKLAKKLAARSSMIRFRLEKIDGKPGSFTAASVTNLDIIESLKKHGLYSPIAKDNGVKIEGLAVRSRPGKLTELFIGLREPDSSMVVVQGEIPTSEGPVISFNLRPAFQFTAGAIANVPFRISSLEYSAEFNGFFILTSTEDAKNKFWGNALWFLGEDRMDKINASPRLIHLFDPAMKAEGLSILRGASKASLKIILAYDNDAEDTKIPGALRILDVEIRQ